MSSLFCICIFLCICFCIFFSVIVFFVFCCCISPSCKEWLPKYPFSSEMINSDDDDNDSQCLFLEPTARFESLKKENLHFFKNLIVSNMKCKHDGTFQVNTSHNPRVQHSQDTLMLCMWRLLFMGVQSTSPGSQVYLYSSMS